MTSSARIEDLHRKYEEDPGRYFAPLADELRRSGDPGRAAILCETHLLNAPGHLSGHVVLGRSLADLGDMAGAERAFSAAVELDPENVVALRALGDIARQRADRHGAREWYQRALEADPRDPELATRMATLDSPVDSGPVQVPVQVDDAHAAEEPGPVEPIRFDASDAAAPDSPEANVAMFGAAVEPLAGEQAPLAGTDAHGAMDLELSEQQAATEFTAGFFAAVLRGATEDEPVEEGALVEGDSGVDEVSPDETAATSAEDPASDEEAEPVEEIEAHGPPASPGAAGFSWSLDIAPVAEIPPRPAAPAPHDDGEPPQVEIAEEPADTLPDESDLLRQIAMLEADLEREVNERRGELPEEEREGPASDLEEPPMGGEGSTLPEEETDHFFDDLPSIVVDRVTPGSTEAAREDVPQIVEHAPSADAPQSSVTPFVTATMASLLVQQGFHADALEVYRQLARQNPADREIAARVEELEARLAGGLAAPGEPDTLGWLRQLAAATPADVPLEDGASADVAPGDGASADVAPEGALSDEPHLPPDDAVRSEQPAGWVDAERDDDAIDAGAPPVDAAVEPAEVAAASEEAPPNPMSDPLVWDDLWGEEATERVEIVQTDDPSQPVSEAGPISLEALAARPVGAEDEAAAGALVAATLAMQGDEELDVQLAEATEEDPGSLTRLLASTPEPARGPGAGGVGGAAAGGITFSFEQFFQPMDQAPTTAATERAEPGDAMQKTANSSTDEEAAAREADLAEFNEWLSRLSES